MVPPAPAQQYRAVEAAVHAHGDAVILQVGTQTTALTPREARQFAYWLAHAYYRADVVSFKDELRRHGGEAA